MNITLRVIQLGFAFVIFFGIMFQMIRKKSNTSVSLIWIIIAAGVMILGFFPKIMDTLSAKLGITYPPTLILVIAIAGITWMVFYLSSQLAVAHTKIRELSMQVTLLNNDVSMLKSAAQSGKDAEDAPKDRSKEVCDG